MKKIAFIFVGMFFGLILAFTTNAEVRNGYELETFQELRQNYEDKTDFSITAAEQMIFENAQRQVRAALPSPGLKVNSHAPDFTLSNAFGKRITLSQELKKGPVVLVFYRGAWCPYCNLYLRALQNTYSIFQKEGAQIIAISPQKPDSSKNNLKKIGFPYEVVSDLKYSTIKNYNLYFEVPNDLVDLYQSKGIDLIKYNGKKPGLPVAATYVIDQNQKVRSVFTDIDYRKRMEPKDILWSLKSIQLK